MPLSLLILALSAFAIGTTEFVIMACCPMWRRTWACRFPALAGW